MSDFAHPAFEPYRDLLAELQGRRGLDALNELASKRGARHAQGGMDLRFANSPAACSAAQYEQGIAASGSVPTREDNLHDFLNALVWLRFPALKSALNLLHCQVLAQQPHEKKQRGRQRDRLTLLDESSMLVISSNPDLLELLRERKWETLLWEARADVLRDMRFIVVGHGLLEKCLAPFPGMTAKCLIIQSAGYRTADIDRLAAERIRTEETPALPPLPVQGIPGWDDNGNPAYYRNTEIFRPARIPLPAA